MPITELSFVRHGKKVQEIFNHYILHTNSLYEYEPRNDQVIFSWFEKRITSGYPILGYYEQLDQRGIEQILGFATYAEFRPQAAYLTSIEHSVYVAPDAQRKGIGGALLENLIAACQQKKIHAMVGVIDKENQPSLLLHKKYGFYQVGELREIAFKNGWRDVVYYQKVLAAAEQA